MDNTFWKTVIKTDRLHESIGGEYTRLMLHTFEDVVRLMESFTNLEKNMNHFTTRTYRLDRMRALLDHLGHPERSFKSLHVAGSKGKGSTSSYLSSGLRALGFKTGLYLSPHVSDYRERWLIDGSFAPDEDLVRAGNELADGIKDFRFSDEWGESSPTTFELYTTFAYLLYRDTRCEWVVLETGLGGRLDATNTVDPEAAVLCPIELEHTKILGDTIEKIATEKSKIIAPRRPVFVGLVKKEAMQVFKNEAEARQSPLFSLEDQLESIKATTTFQGEQAELHWKDGTQDQLLLSMNENVQAQNCALALMTLRHLGLYDETKTIPALEKTRLPARFEKISDKPAIYLDGAHTVNSLKALLESYDALYPDEGGRVAIYGALLDKDHQHMCEVMEHSFDHIIVSTPGTWRKSDIAQIARIFQQQAPGKDIRLIPDNKEALETAKELAGTKGSILVCGSFYLCGAIRSLV